MKELIKKFLLIVRLSIVSPLLLPFFLTTEKNIILADIKRWVEALGWQKRSEIIQLLTLLWEAPEYRNLYYFRLFKGNLSGKALISLLKIVYRQCPYFFLDSSCTIGPGLFIQHGFSTIIMADIGENAWINQQVTIGYKDKTGRPKIGDNVTITAGAKVIGNVRIGNNVTIGANAVVIKDVPDNCVVVGVPAYIVKRNGVRVREELVS